jgi:cell division transport system ATP-binding protein
LLSLSILPTRGDLMIFGQNISDVSKRDRANMRTKIGVIFQDFRLIPHLTIYENITLPLKLMNIFEEKQKQSVMDVLDWIGLKNHAHMKPAFLSGGQQQRAAIARAVITKPKILLADEPTGSLDTNIGLRIISLFQELNRNGTAILLATHNKSLIEMHPYPVLTLEKGGLSI